MLMHTGYVFLLGLVSLFLVSTASVAENPPAAASAQVTQDTNALRARRIAEAARYTVKVSCTTANLFTPVQHGGHGTGFIADLNSERGLIFTNHHVVRADPLDARLVVLSFQLPNGDSEQIPGRVVYESPNLDFAAIQFDPTRLRRARANLQVAPLATDAEFETVAAQGREVMAYGYPLDSDYVATYGALSTRFYTPVGGMYLQTQAPINPGNSGGPMIDLESGKVIAVNSMKKVMRGAELIGYSIPITRVMAMFRAWVADPTLASQHVVLAHFANMSDGDLESEGVSNLVTAEDPNFFDNHYGVLVVTEAAPHTTLQRHDILLRVNGQMVASDAEWVLHDMINAARSPLAVVVIRDGKRVELQVPVNDIGRTIRAQQNLFLMISGVVFQQYAVDRYWAIGQGESSVFVSHIVANMAGDRTPLIPGSLLVEVQMAGKTYPIRNLNDLAQVIRDYQQGPSDRRIRLVVREPIVLGVENGQPVFQRNPRYGGRQVSTERRIISLSVDSLASPENLPLQLMRANFDHGGRNFPETRLWSNWVAPHGRCIAAVIAAAEAEEKKATAANGGTPPVAAQPEP